MIRIRKDCPKQYAFSIHPNVKFSVYQCRIRITNFKETVLKRTESYFVEKERTWLHDKSAKARAMRVDGRISLFMWM